MTTSEYEIDEIFHLRCDGMRRDSTIDDDFISRFRLLTLPSGWRIQFNDNVNFIFETHDLIHASPATISRMGIVNLRYILQYVYI